MSVEKGPYNRPENFYPELLGLYKNTSLGVRAYLSMRLKVAGYDRVFPLIPENGRVLDLGCGYGLFSNLVALTRTGVDVVGVDPDKERIKVAASTVRDRKNITFQEGRGQELQPGELFNTIVCCDVLHHIPKDEQITVLEALTKSVYPNAVLILKEIDKKPLAKYYINLLHDSLISGPPLYFRSVEEWVRLLSNLGWKCESTSFGKVYPHVLIKATRE